MAAFLMLSGVGKSGSPALKSTTSTPSRRKRSASAATFMVDDSLISDMRLANSSTLGILNNTPLVFLLQSAIHRGRHHSGDISAQLRHFLHQVRADKGILVPRHQ